MEGFMVHIGIMTYFVDPFLEFPESEVFWWACNLCGRNKMIGTNQIFSPWYKNCICFVLCCSS